MNAITHELIVPTQTLKALILENEPLGLKNLKMQLAHSCKNVQVLAETGSIANAREILQGNQDFDIAFLDIYLDDGMVFSLLPELRRRGIDFLFVSAYPEHAAKAFKLDAAHFVTKPIDPDDLIEAVNRVIIRKELGIVKPSFGEIKKRITLPTNKGYYIANVDDIIRCTADDTCTYFYFESRKRMHICGNIGSYQKELNPYNLFFRVERSHIVNVDYVSEMINEDGETSVILKNGDKVPLARRRRKAFKDFISGRF